MEQSFHTAGRHPTNAALSFQQSAAHGCHFRSCIDGATVYTATASVSIGATADAPRNPITNVAFYANGSLLGALASSPDAPLYAMTTTGFSAGAS